MAKTAKPASSLLTALSQALGRFFAWWGGELAAVLPPGLRLWWRESDRIVTLSFTGERMLFEQPAGKGRAEILSLPAGAHSAQDRAEAGRRLQQSAGADYRLVICLPQEQVLRRALVLPLAIEENLRQSLSFELDKYTPFRPDQAYFDCRVTGRDANGKRLSVELAVAPKSAVDEAVARAAALGLSVDAVVPAEEALRAGGDCHDFLPAGAKQRKPSRRLWWRAGMAALAVVLLAVFLAIPIWQKRAAAIALLDPLARAKAAALETDALRDRLRKMVDEHNYLHGKKWESYPSLLVLHELSRLLPDDTYLVQLDFDGKTVQIMGDSASSSSLVETLEASPLFKDVGFKSQLVKLPGTPYDRFQISATLEEAGRPRPPNADPSGAAAPSPAPSSSPAAGTGGRPKP